MIYDEIIKIPCQGCLQQVCYSIGEWRKGDPACPRCGTRFDIRKVDESVREFETRHRNRERNLKRLSKW